MKGNAIVESAIELVDLFFNNLSKPCDLVIKEYMLENKYIGSKERKLVSFLYFSVIRSFWSLVEYLKNVKTPYPFFNDDVEAEIVNGRMLVAAFLITNWMTLIDDPYITNNLDVDSFGLRTFNFMKIFSGEKNEPNELTDNEKKILNGIDLSFVVSDSANVGLSLLLFKEFIKSFENFYDGIVELKKFQDEAPFTLIVNKISGKGRSEVINELTSENIMCAGTRISDSGISLLKRQNIKNHKLFKSGKIEIQDEGSQIIAKLASFVPNVKSILDYCAGAGGKAIGIINEMYEKNVEITLTDISDFKLENANLRIKKLMSGAKDKKSFPKVEIYNVSELNNNNEKKFDLVLVDVPCSGFGTIRRSPDLSIKTTLNKLFQINTAQTGIMNSAQKHVKNGGYILYVTCSALIRENENIIQKFLNENENFIVKNIKEILKETNLNFLKINENFLKLSPAKTGTDGFFCCGYAKNFLMKISYEESFFWIMK